MPIIELVQKGATYKTDQCSYQKSVDMFLLDQFHTCPFIPSV